MKAQRRCWWCGRTAEVDTGVDEPQNGLVKDQEPDSWICAGPCGPQLDGANTPNP